MDGTNVMRPPNLFSVMLWTHIASDLRPIVRAMRKDSGEMELEAFRRTTGELLRGVLVNGCRELMENPRFASDGPPAMQYVVDRLVAEIAGEELAARN